jgi:glycosyltransferase involved in cell wall biosynthesis
MGKTPLVSVIMPVFNGAKTIKMALNSLINQTYQNWTCIIVNDGSTDGTKDILDTLKDSRFRVIHLVKNIGRGAARQVALEHSKGDYLAYLDADDFYHSEKLQKQITILTDNKSIALVGCRILCFDSNYNSISTRGAGSKKAIPFKYGDNLGLVMPTAMIRLPDAKDHKYNLKMNAAEDVDYFSRYLDKRSYINLPDVLLYYSVTESTTYKKVLEYTGFEITRGFTMFGRNKKSAARVVITSAFKWLIYATVIPFLGTKFFLNRRGAKIQNDEIITFQYQKTNMTNTLQL